MIPRECSGGRMFVFKGRLMNFGPPHECFAGTLTKDKVCPLFFLWSTPRGFYLRRPCILSTQRATVLLTKFPSRDSRLSKLNRTLNS